MQIASFFLIVFIAHLVNVNIVHRRGTASKECLPECYWGDLWGALLARHCIQLFAKPEAKPTGEQHHGMLCSRVVHMCLYVIYFTSATTKEHALYLKWKRYKSENTMRTNVYGYCWYCSRYIPSPL